MNNNREIEKKLKEEIESVVPDVLENIKQNAKAQSDNTVVLNFETKKKKRNTFKTVSAVAAVFAVVFASLYLYLFAPQKNNFSVELDVNPGVLLEVDKNEKVIGVTKLNKDADIVLDGMDLKGSNLNVAVNALMFSIIKNGYINEMTNSVLLSVSDSLNNEKITKELTEQINCAFEENSLEGSVLVQTVNQSSEIEEIAKKYSITTGKASLIKNLVDSGKTNFTYDALAALSINELNILMSQSTTSSQLTVVGSASTKAYIGEKAAKEIAYAAFGKTANEIRHSECSLDLDDGQIVYEVEFIALDAVYECEIDALTGEVLSFDFETVKIPQSAQVPETTISNQVTLKTKEEIKEAVLALNSFNANDCKKFEIELDYDKGIAKYEVEFIHGTTEYEYEINAVDASVISVSTKAIEPTTQEPTAQEQTTTVAETTTTEESIASASSSAFEKGFIGREKAIEIALQRASLKKDDVRKIEVEFGYNNGVVYCVEFKSGANEYEIDIDATSGEIVDFECEKDD